MTTPRTYKARRGRVTRRQRAALEHASGPMLGTHTWSEIAGGWREVVLEIGFGTGAATAEMAAAEPDRLIIACDVHTPGVGDLLARIEEQRLANVRVVEGDALLLLRDVVPERALAGVRSFFPDPWPKARHHKRRLVQEPHVSLIASRLRPGGWWHLATDWAEYAEQMAQVLIAAGWTGGPIPRPADRPITRYERIAIAAGRPVLDLQFAPETGANGNF